MLLIWERLPVICPVGLVWFARHCGKLYSRHLFSYTVDCFWVPKHRKVSLVRPQSVSGRFRLREWVNTAFVWEFKRDSVKAVVSRAVRFRVSIKRASTEVTSPPIFCLFSLKKRTVMTVCRTLCESFIELNDMYSRTKRLYAGWVRCSSWYEFKIVLIGFSFKSKVCEWAW